jgi:hypothetical protein
MSASLVNRSGPNTQGGRNVVERRWRAQRPWEYARSRAMTSKITPGVSFLGMVVGALLVVAPAGADEVVAELTRDTPIAACGVV